MTKTSQMTKEELIEENEMLRTRIEEMRRQDMTKSPLGGKEKALMDIFSDISDAILDIGEMPADDDVFCLIATKLRSFSGAGMVTVNEWDPRKSTLIIRAHSGGEKLLKPLMKLTGQKVINNSYEILDETYDTLMSGELERVPGGLYTLMFEKVPKPICRSIEKLIGLKQIYTMGFTHGGELFGNVVLLTFRNETLPYPDIIETFVRQFSVSLQRRKALRQLQQSESHYRFMTENVRDIIFVLDDRLRYEYLSPSTFSITGYHPEELVGVRAFDLEAESAENKDFIAFLEEVLKNPGSVDSPREFVVEKKIQKSDTTYGDFEVSFCAVFDEHGSTKGLMGVARDITARKESEQELAKIQKLDSLGILAGGIAHDFNNALTTIQGDILLSQKNIDSPECLSQRLSHALRACKQARSLTLQLLTFSRGGTPIKKRLSTESIVQKGALFSLSDTDIELDFSFEDELWEIQGDPDQLLQVFNNLFLNSRHAMEGNGKITVRAKNCSKPKTVDSETDSFSTQSALQSFVKIEVQDTGMGIPEKNISRIFDPYFSTKPKGMGLGLSTVYSILKRHGGTIQVSSNEEKGACFTIFMPAMYPLESTDILSTKSTSQPGDTCGDTDTLPPITNKEKNNGKGKVLVMDDDEGVREIAELFLLELGYEPTLTHEGKDAVRLYEEAMNRGEPFLAVIMDMIIPGGMDGKETAKKILRIHPEAKLIMASGYSDDIAPADHRAYGFCAVLVKPFGLVTLDEALEALLNDPHCTMAMEQGKHKAEKPTQCRHPT